MTNRNDYYVYQHTFKNGKIYVGKGTADRSMNFRTRSKYWKRVYNKYGAPTVTYIDADLDEATAHELEEFCISCYIEVGYELGGTLINFTNGGEGASGYRHTEEAKQIISTAAKKALESKEARLALSERSSRFWQSSAGKQKKSAASKAMWKNGSYRTSKISQIKAMWQNEELKAKASAAMTGANNPAARIANIYDYKTGEVIAENVVSAEWARNNGYSRSKLQITSKADRSRPSSKDNPHHHKGVYMEYIDGK